MGFMDKAKQMAEQAQQKIEEAQKQFNESQAQKGAGAESGGQRFDEHGRPIADAPPAAATPAAPVEPAAPAPAAPLPRRRRSRLLRLPRSRPPLRPWSRPRRSGSTPNTRPPPSRRASTAIPTRSNRSSDDSDVRRHTHGDGDAVRRERRLRRGRSGAAHAPPARERIGRSRPRRDHRRGAHAHRRGDGLPVGDRSRVSGDAPCIAGTGTNDTRHTIELTERAAEAGADGALVVTPYYNKPNRRGLIEHFRAVAAATDLPIVLYNIPSRTALDMPNDLLRELAEIETVVGGEAGPLRGHAANRGAGPAGGQRRRARFGARSRGHRAGSASCRTSSAPRCTA